jgi:hypothetical protein
MQIFHANHFYGGSASVELHRQGAARLLSRLSVLPAWPVQWLEGEPATNGSSTALLPPEPCSIVTVAF